VHGTGRISSNLNNGTLGEVRALPGEDLQFLASANSNSGSINLFGGMVEFTGSLSNSSTGRITGRGELIVHNGLSNSGSLTFSSGLSDMTGTLTNNSGGKTIVTGGASASFYDPVTNSNGSEFRVSTASTAVFLSPVVGLSLFTGPGTKDFEAGASGGPVATFVGNTIVGPDGNVLTSFIHENSVSVQGNAAVLPNGTPASLSRINTLDLSGGTLDLSNNDLIVDATPLASVRADIVTAYNSGSWTGAGLTSSAAASIAADNLNLHKTALGYASASTLGVSSFDGQTVNGSSVLVRYTYLGDANLDGKVNALDFNLLASNFGGSSILWNQGDFNYDGVVNSVDFTSLAVNFNSALTAPALGGLLPEPTSIAALALTSVFGWRRRSHTPR
jgi:hypothetical protein